VLTPKSKKRASALFLLNNSMNTDDFVLDLPELNYDRSKMEELFEQLKPNFRIKGLPWWGDVEKKEYDINDINKYKGVVVQYGEHMMIDPTKSHLSVNLLDFKIVRDIAERLNLDEPINPYSVDINWYRVTDFYFEPHVDYYASSTMIFPIIPEQDFQPIDFYDRSKVDYVEGETHSFEDILKDEDILHTHYYGSNYGTIFNSHWPHGIRPLSRANRAALRFRTKEKFSSIMAKYKNGTLLK
jgi:hypothetical protein